MISNIYNSYNNNNLLKYYFNNANRSIPKQPPKQYSEPTYTKSVYNDSDLSHTSWFYINDLHGKMTKMERIYNMVQQFDRNDASKTDFFRNTTNDKVAKFKVSSGDISIGCNPNNNKVAYKFLDWCGFDATELGNHEMDVVEPGDLASLIDNTNCKMLALNVKADENSPLANKFQKSVITENNGEKVGIIGIAPSDMFDRVKMSNTLNSIKVANIDETIKLVQQEVDNLRKQGINKIALLSHSGIDNDKKIISMTDGIDIIFGGHTHNLIEGVTEGKNLFYSKSGEPVIMTQAGKNGEYIGILNVDFDKNGIIKRVQNNVIPTSPYNRPLYVKDAVEKIIGKPEIVGRVGEAVPMPKHILIEDNPHGNLIADAMRSELDTDIAILNTGNIRGRFTSGAEVDSRLLADISPFEDKMMVLKLSEKQIVDAIKTGLELSFNSKNHKPGILLVSGMRYKCNNKGELLNLEFIDRNNNSHKIDINNPDENKTYTVAADDFFAMGGDNYLPSNLPESSILKTLDFDKNKLACDYIKKQTQPIDIKYDGRLEIINDTLP
ncbi:bifunctional metallophosphatase/5'-nucleotidase [bacterium]|nr:bifunctional metallophosphatase/5'-nucleotidase [bacterium]